MFNKIKKAFESPKAVSEARKEIKEKEGQEFNFTAKEVLETLSSKKNKIEYVGSATSHFQAEPLVFDEKGEPIIVSDWEMETVKNIKGEKGQKIITGKPTEVSELPKFLSKKEEYIKRSAELGENMFRFSLDFPRLCPAEGVFDEKLMADYVKALALVRAHGQEPLLNIYHWPMPKYLLELDKNENIKKGGWENPDVNKHFSFYVKNVIKYLADEDKVRASLESVGLDKDGQDKFLAEGLVRYFLTLNEPTSITGTGYLQAAFPPFKIGRVDLYYKLLKPLVEAHDIAMSEVKGRLSKINPKVGMTHAWHYFDGVLSGAWKKFLDTGPTDAFERNGAYSDFLGLQYYFRMSLGSYPSLGPKWSGKQYSDQPTFGDIYPKGIYENLKLMSERYPQKEIFVCEFGFSDKKDIRRPYWILETLRYILEAKKAGVPVKGILLWSLVNNFEWNYGMTQKFGLFSEDELSKSLEPSKGDKIRSWEAWKAAAKAIKNPSPESLQELQTYYEKAKKQFEAEVSKSK